jgi:hypothetical protein
MIQKLLRAATVVLAICISPVARGETPEEWIKLLTRVHGGFGSFLPVGIRIGERCDQAPGRQATRVVGDVLSG